MSRVASGLRPVGVCRAAVRRSLASCIFIIGAPLHFGVKASIGLETNAACCRHRKIGGIMPNLIRETIGAFERSVRSVGAVARSARILQRRAYRGSLVLTAVPLRATVL